MINDGSKDNTKEIIGKFLNKIVYMENKINRGLPYSLNKGIKKAKGKYIVRLDSDDYVNRDFLLILYLFLNQNINFDAVSYDYIIDDDNEKVIKEDLKKPIGCAIMFKTDDLIKIGLYNKNFKLHEDKELMEKLKTFQRYKNTFAIDTDSIQKILLQMSKMINFINKIKK